MGIPASMQSSAAVILVAMPPVPCAVIVELLTQHGLSEYDFEPPLELEKEDLQGRGVIV